MLIVVYINSDETPEKLLVGPDMSDEKATELSEVYDFGWVVLLSISMQSRFFVGSPQTLLIRSRSSASLGSWTDNSFAWAMDANDAIPVTYTAMTIQLRPSRISVHNEEAGDWAGTRIGVLAGRAIPALIAVKVGVVASNKYGKCWCAMVIHAPIQRQPCCYGLSLIGHCVFAFWFT